VAALPTPLPYGFPKGTALWTVIQAVRWSRPFENPAAPHAETHSPLYGLHRAERPRLIPAGPNDGRPSSPGTPATPLWRRIDHGQERGDHRHERRAGDLD